MNKIPISLSLVVPVFNEEQLVKETISIYSRDLKKLVRQYEIVVVDDGSSDSTAEILRKLKKKISVLKVLRHKTNLGVGKAIMDGFEASEMDWVMTNSADRPFNLGDLKKARRAFNSSDIIVVSRYNRSANPLFRKLTSKISYYLVRIFFRVPISDFHFVQVYRRKPLSSIKIFSQDTFAPAELLVRLYKLGYKVTQFQAQFHRRTAGVSKYNNPLRYLRYLSEMIKFWIRLRAESKSMKGEEYVN